MFISILNIIGMTINFAGALMVFLANTSIEYHIGLLPNEEDLLKMGKNKVKTRLFRIGMGILSVGFLIQLIALIMPLIQVYITAKPH